jgi:hypothetical protein
MKYKNNPVWNFIKTIMTALPLIALLALHSGTTLAKETVGEKIDNKSDEAKRDAKRNVRKAKRAHRKATETDNIGKDAKDHLDNASDAVGTEANKLKRKAD